MSGHAPLRRLLLVAAVLATSACGYTLAGRGNTLPPGIVTIGIPAIVNQSVIGDIDRVFTEAVTVEFQSKGKYRVLPQAEGVDAVLTGRIVNVSLLPVAFTTNQQVASRVAIVATAAIEFREVATDRLIWSNPSFQVRDEYDVNTGSTTSDISALLTSNTNALERLSRTFARSVVTAIFEAF
jgi:hypothetical protein